MKGGYVLKDFGDKPEIILMASGSEVALIMGAAEKLYEEGTSVRVVSMPSFELFERQSKEYREEVLPCDVRKRVSVEVYNDAGWYRYVGLDGKVVNLARFGASAPGNLVFEDLKFTADGIYQEVKEIL